MQDSIHPQDKPIGITIIVLNALCGGLGLLAVLGLGAIAAMGGAAAAGSGGSADGAAAAAAVGGIAAIIAIVVVVLCAVGIIAGFGIMKSAKWGFQLGAVVFGLNALSNLAQLPQGVIGLLISGALCYYCIARLTGKIGPKPA